MSRCVFARVDRNWLFVLSDVEPFYARSTTTSDGSCKAGGHADSGRANRRSLVFQERPFVTPCKTAFSKKLTLYPLYGSVT